MKVLLYSLLCASLLIACRPTVPHELQIGALDLERQWPSESIDSLIATFRHFPNNTQFAIGILTDSTTEYFGFVRQRDTLLRIENAERVFEIGSISKVFTANLLAQFVVQGRLELNEPIQNYLDYPLKSSLEINFLQLANHTSGLPRLPPDMFWSAIFNRKNPYKNYDREKLETYLKEKIATASEPGTTYQYSNLGAGTLGYVLSEMSGQTYEELLQTLIFQGLDMQSSTTNRSLVEEKLVIGLSKSGKPTANWDLAALAGAGAIVSSAADLAKFARKNFSEDAPAYRLQQTATFSVNEDMAMALGWHILQRKSGANWHWHNGGTGGYRSSLGLDLDRQQAVIILTNMSAGHAYSQKIDNLCFTLLK